MKPLKSQDKNIKTRPNTGNDKIARTFPVNKTTTEKVPVSINENTVYTYDVQEVPSGVIDVDKNGIYNVRQYAEAKVHVRGGSTDIYDGDYIVTPSAHREIILETTDKVMEDDVTVLQIPYYETSNITGYTVYIADNL